MAIPNCPLDGRVTNIFDVLTPFRDAVFPFSLVFDEVSSSDRNGDNQVSVPAFRMGAVTSTKSSSSIQDKFLVFNALSPKDSFEGLSNTAAGGTCWLISSHQPLL
jgi:hypothetical protein